MLLIACGKDDRDKPAKQQKPVVVVTKPDIAWKTGPMELLPGDGGRLVPNGMRVGDQRVAWKSAGLPEQGFTFVYDENANGDIADDTPHKLTKVGDAWEVTFAQKIESMFAGDLIEAPTRIRVRDDGEVRIQQAVARRGTLTAPSGPMQFALIGDSGQFGLDHHFIAFDLNRDGKLDLERLDNEELFHVFEKTITLDTKSYKFILDPAGEQLTLEPLPNKLPPRPPLTTGTPAPEIAITDLDGKAATLAGLRGKVVLVDFWATACAPCIAAFPRIAELHAKHHAQGFEVMSVAMDTPDVREVLGAHRTGVAAISDAAQALYRVDRFPMYFLIARDGTIACSRCQLDKVEAMLAAELARK